MMLVSDLLDSKPRDNTEPLCGHTLLTATPPHKNACGLFGGSQCYNACDTYRILLPGLCSILLSKFVSDTNHLRAICG